LPFWTLSSSSRAMRSACSMSAGRPFVDFASGGAAFFSPRSVDPCFASGPFAPGWPP
jgi:hypothetical protein